jgi:hypothetical protein
LLPYSGGSEYENWAKGMIAPKTSKEIPEGLEAD